MSTFICFSVTSSQLVAAGVGVDEVWAAHLDRRWPQTYQQTATIFDDATRADHRQLYLEKHFHELLRFAHFNQHMGEPSAWRDVS